MTNDSASSYTTTITVDRSPNVAFAAIVNARAWWSEEIDGPTGEVSGEFDYHYQDVHRSRIRVTELEPGRRVAWHILENHFNFVQAQDEWTGTDVVFDIEPTDTGGARVRFTHVGLVPQHECYDVCSNAWGGYITGSLRDLINTGLGQPNLKKDGVLAAHQDTATVQREGRPTSVA